MESRHRAFFSCPLVLGGWGIRHINISGLGARDVDWSGSWTVLSVYSEVFFLAFSPASLLLLSTLSLRSLLFLIRPALN